mgnify:CR=1 FL=1|tara:strand:+ start:418 stop:3144 length:2727 start_codon:yes stop_codon:yes gene_type:complete
MSVQLILYPQNYDGVFNSITNSSTEVIVNGTSFVNLNASPSYAYIAASIDPEAVVTNAPPVIMNSWYRFSAYASGSPAPAFPTVSGGDVTFYTELTTGLNSASGIYQKLSNLTIGQQYQLTLTLTATSVASFSISYLDGTTLYAQTNPSAGSLVITSTFTAQSVDTTVMISYEANIVASVTASSVSLQPVSNATAGTATLSDGQVICDLYEDEDIPLTLSVDNFKNVAEKPQSYSKAFNLPATKRNNQIFNQIFEITRDADGIVFSPYKRTQCVLKQDGYILFKGFLRLLDVTEKDGEISYNVNLYAEVVALADVLKDRTFSDLDFTELEHDYNKSEIKRSWNNGVTAGQTTPITWNNPSTSTYRTNFNTLKYPFVNWNNNWLIANGSTGSNATLGNPELTSLEQAFRPFINIKYLIDRIFQDTTFTFTSDFFDTIDFKKLYMDFNWGSGNAPVVFINSATSGFPNYISYTVGVNTVDFPFVSIDDDFGYSTGVFTAQADNQIYNITYNIEMMSAAGGPYTLTCEWVDSTGTIYNTQTLTPNLVGSSSFTFYSGTFSSIPLSLGDTLFCRFTVVSGTITIIDNQINSFMGTTSAFNTTSDTLLGTLRGELGQWEFLKGLITMFNLVTLPDENNPNNIVIEPYVDKFTINTAGAYLKDRGIEYDWTDKIDVSQMKLTPLDDLNKNTILKFVEDDDDFAFQNYKNQVGGFLYGSKEYDAWNEFNILDGLKEIIAEPFAATVVKPLASQFPAFITPALYAYNSEDGTSEGFENSPRIMYDNGIQDTGASFYIPAQNGGTSSNTTDFLQFSHIKNGGLAISGYQDFHFGECQLLGNQASTLNNLFNLYWLPYFNQLYNPNTRTMTIKVDLSPSDINLFKFNDVVFLKNRAFRVNKIDYKPNDLATVEFILIP